MAGSTNIAASQNGALTLISEKARPKTKGPLSRDRAAAALLRPRQLPCSQGSLWREISAATLGQAIAWPNAATAIRLVVTNPFCDRVSRQTLAAVIAMPT